MISLRKGKQLTERKYLCYKYPSKDLFLYYIKNSYKSTEKRRSVQFGQNLIKKLHRWVISMKSGKKKEKQAKQGT